MKKKFDIYEAVNKTIIDLLEAGTVPWHKPWSGGDPPANLISKKPYRGMNVLILGCKPYASRYWLTYKQCAAIGGQVRTGEKSTMIVFWKFLQVTDKDSGDEKTIPMLRYYNVFNTEQCDAIDPKKIPACDVTEHDNDPIEGCEALSQHYLDNGPTLTHDAPRAYYTPSRDAINMPQLASFDGAEEYYGTLFHEMVHSTGHDSRLKRIKDVAAFGGNAYSKEELVAEYGAAYLCTMQGIENKTIDNSAAYIQSWLNALQDDKTLLVSACGQAQKAVDLITA